jgi:hypothetical protein
MNAKVCGDSFRTVATVTGLTRSTLVDCLRFELSNTVVAIAVYTVLEPDATHNDSCKAQSLLPCYR